VTVSLDPELVHAVDQEVRAHHVNSRSAVVEEALRRELGGLVSWPAPRGGFFLWASFPDRLNTDALLPRAVARGVLYVPGSAFYVGHAADNRARLSFSAASPERLVTGIQRLALAVREELASTTASEP